MARTIPEAIIIVLDVGPSVGQQLLPNGETFLSNAQLCATHILQRKILAGSKDEVGLILLGSEETNNPLADGEGYNNIEISHTLQLADWTMVKTIADYKNCTTSDGDWLDALIVAADYMKSATEGKKYKEKKIVLLSNCSSNVSDDEVACVIQGLRAEEVQVIAIGPHVYATESQGHPCEDNKSEEQQEGEKLISRITAEVDNSVICCFEDAIAQLRYFELKKTRPTPWRAVMDIGSKIQIPVVGYKKVADVKAPAMHNIIMSYNRNRMMSAAAESKQESAAHGTSSLLDLDINRVHPDKIETQDGEHMDLDDGEEFGLIDKDRIYQTVGDDAAPVSVEDVIEGYMFGATIVAVTDADKPALAYSAGEKCLSVLGFTKKQNVPLHLHTGDGCYLFFSENEENCLRAFSALIQAMDAKDMVAIVRKVYRRGSTPTMCALFPMITPDFQCFVCIELPYAEEVKTLLFPPLVGEKNKPSKDQLDAVDQLITSMDLMASQYEEDTETGLYDPHKTLDPYEQHFHSVVAKKALNRDKYFSGSEVDEAVKLLLSPNEELLESAKPSLDKIKGLFPLTEIVPKEGARKTAADIFKQNKLDDTATSSPSKQPSASSDVAIHIGTINPQEDFKKLVDCGTPLEKACSLMAQVISNLVSKAFDADDFGKPFKCLILMRKVCLEKSPVIFNDWISKFKNDLPSEKVGFWELIANDKAGLITSSETNLSNISDDAARQFLQVDDAKDETLAPQDVDEDLDDLINQM